MDELGIARLPKLISNVNIVVKDVRGFGESRFRSGDAMGSSCEQFGYGSVRS